MNIKSIFTKYKRYIAPLLYAKNLVSSKIRIRGSNNRIMGLDRVLSNGSFFIEGNNNTIILGEMSTINKASFHIEGDNNTIFIGERCYLQDCVLCVEDDLNEIRLGDHTYVHNQTEIAAIEGTKITFGADCLLSSEIKIRAGDSHVIYSVDSGERTNASEDIEVGDHVWIGNRAIVLKGAKIAAGVIISTMALVTSSCPTESNTVIAGVPAKVIKKDVTWYADRRNFKERECN